MSFKKTVTFTAKVSDYTDGTVTARVQAENNILSQFVAWLLSINTSISQLEKVEIGDAKWSGYPLYAVQSGAPSAITSSLTAWSVLSDVYMLGKNKGNFCLAVSVDNHHLTLAPSCSFEYQDTLNAYQSKSLSIISEQVRWLRSSNISTRTSIMGQMDLFSFSTEDDELSMTLNYWRGGDSLVFGVRGKTERVFMSMDSEDSCWGWSVTTYNKLCCYSFNEIIQAANETQTLSSYTESSAVQCLAKGYACNVEPFWWGSMSSSNAWGYSSPIFSISPVPIRMHLLSFSSARADDTNSQNDAEINMTNSSDTRVMCGKSFLNLPRISSDQLYLRKIYVPNRQTSAPVKLAYTPGMLYQDAVYTVNDKHYVCLQGAWRTYMVEVSDQG